MSSAIPLFTWEESLHEFSLHLQATRAQKTQRYYEVQLGGLVRWATQENVPFAGFGKRHMDRYLVSRAETGKAPLTLHHDAVCAKAFFRWCQKNDIIERSLLADYEIRRAPRAARYMPTDGEMQGLLRDVAPLDILSRFDLGQVRSQIEWMPHRGAKNPARYLMAAIENNYEAPVAVRAEQAERERGAEH